MEALLTLLLAASLFVEIKHKSKYTSIKPSVQTSSKDSIPPGTGIIDFNTRIQPIFISHCSPCHFKGGKMYDRLPFDKDTTIINHEAAILRRIKEQKENELIKQYVQQQDK